MGFRKNADIFHPARFWICLWTMVIGVTLLDLSYYQREWSIQAWFIILSGLLSFLVGVLLQANKHRALIMKKIPFDIQKILSPNSRKGFMYAIYFLFTVYIIAYLLEWKIMGYLPFFSILREAGRAEWGVFGLHLLVGSIPIILALVSEAFIVLKTKKTEKILYSSIFFLTLVSYFFLLNRLYIFIWGFILIIQIHYLKKRIKVRQILIFTTVLTGLFVGIGSIRATQFVGNFIYNVSNMKYSKEYANFTGPYMYVSMNLENTARGIDKLSSHTYGANVFDFIYAILQAKKPIAKYLHIDKYQYLVTSSFNTLSYLWYLYWDFGIPGVVIGSMLWGYLISMLYYKMRLNPSFTNVNMYALTLFMVFLSFFTFLPMMLSSVYHLIIMYFLSRYIDNPKVFAHIKT